METFESTIRTFRGMNRMDLWLVPHSPAGPDRKNRRLLIWAIGSRIMEWLDRFVVGVSKIPGASGDSEYGMRLALAMVWAEWPGGNERGERFLAGVLNLPDAVVLYWFTLCFYGSRQKAARKALRALLTEQDD